MNKPNLTRFLNLDRVKYGELEWSGEHEMETDLTHKQQWGEAGAMLLASIAEGIEAVPVTNINPSGSIDRGYVSAFIEKDGKVVYISINDGMRDILYRTAEHVRDYTGGSNHTASITSEGFAQVEQFVTEHLCES